MQYDPNRHHRRSIRLRGYDYTQAGLYFVTVCLQDRACLFGEVVHAEIRPNDAGRMVLDWWDELVNAFPDIDLDAFALMPNHIHGIIVLETRPDIPEHPPLQAGGHIGPPGPTGQDR